MNLLKHFLWSLVLAAILFPFYSFDSLFVLIGGVLIDIDHLLHYCLKFKKINLKEAYYYYMAKNNYLDSKGDLFLLHTVEFLIICIALSFYYKPFLIISAGFLLHFVLDAYNEYFIFKEPVKAKSFFYWFFEKYVVNRL